jgi:4-hydroxybenzoyl-CoA reductase subunit alpha
MKEFDIISTRANRIDTPDKATGRAVFVDDISRPGMLYGALLQSPHAHAKILSIDTSKAEKLKGVKAVITAKEAGSIKYGVSPARYDETVFAVDKVRYVGDEIAAVAAESLDIALAAVELIKVEYEILPAFTRRITQKPLRRSPPGIRECGRRP